MMEGSRVWDYGRQSLQGRCSLDSKCVRGLESKAPMAGQHQGTRSCRSETENAWRYGKFQNGNGPWPVRRQGPGRARQVPIRLGHQSLKEGFVISLWGGVLRRSLWGGVWCCHVAYSHIWSSTRSWHCKPDIQCWQAEMPFAFSKGLVIKRAFSKGLVIKRPEGKV